MFTTATILAAGSAIVSTAGAISSIATGKKYKKLCERLNTSVDAICKQDIKLDDLVTEEVVNAAIERKVKEQLDISVPKLEQSIKNTFAEQLRAEVRKEINAQYSDIKSEVKREIKDQIGRIDINEAKKEVLADAKENAARLFREEYKYRMDELVDNAGEEIKDVVKRARTDISHALDIHQMLTDFSKK